MWSTGYWYWKRWEDGKEVIVQSIIFLSILFQKYGIIKSVKEKASLSFSIAEKKLLIVFIYYIIIQVIVFIYFSQSQQVGFQIRTEIARYFQCELNGHDPSNPCSRSGFENLINPALPIMAFTVALLLPIVSFVFVIDYETLKNKLRSLAPSRKSNAPDVSIKLEATLQTSGQWI